jgi:CheY-like chemotaxis protein
MRSARPFNATALQETPKTHTFLIVENDPNDAFLIRRALSSGKCGNPVLCRNASEAKSYLKGAGMYQNRDKFPIPDLILTDLRMDDESGIELVEWIRQQQPPLRDIKILILTGSATPLQFDAATKVGAQGVHRKPPRIEDLQKLLEGIAAQFCAPDEQPEP